METTCLQGGSGDNTLDGGDGTDTAIFMGARRVDVDLDKESNAVVEHKAPTGGVSLRDATDSGVGTDTLISIENVKGTHGDDVINGDGSANVLKGLDGKDTINGKGGDDTILPNRPAMLNAMGDQIANVTDIGDVANVTPEGGVDGADVIDGGDGSDTISYEGESENVTAIPTTP